jgi:molybdopterin/thiamine biosynthesis adenylyltransferase
MARHATVVGFGNIGSALAGLLGNIAGLETVQLIDDDVYTESNVGSQSISREAVGIAKVVYQGERLRREHPSLRVEAVMDRIENVPLASLRGSILVGCVDNRSARQTCNRMACRLGLDYVDGSVQAPSLARVAAFGPAESTPCLECGWDDAVYASLDQRYACRPGAELAPASGASPELGAAVAALQAAELRKRLEAPTRESSLCGGQFMLDTASYSGSLHRFSRNAACRFDHRVWDIEVVDLDLACSLDELFDACGDLADPAFELEGLSFATYLDCRECGKRSTLGLALPSRLSAAQRACECGGLLQAPGFYSFGTLRRAELSATQRRRTLAALGLKVGDVVSISNGHRDVQHFEIGGVPDE